MRKSEVIAAESVACLNKALCHLKDIWEEIGVPEEQRLERTNVVKNHVKSLLDMMIAEEESLRSRLMTGIKMCHEELKKLCLELQLPVYQDEVSGSMLQKEKKLRSRVEEMLEEKNHRMQALKALLEEDQDLCDVLCSETFSVSASCVPSLEQLDEFRQHIAVLTAEKERRHEEFVLLKKQIILCMDDLDQLPETTFEKDVVCEDEEGFCLSKENIDSLRMLLHQLENRKADNERVCKFHREKILELWERLQIPKEERDVLSEHMTMSKKRNMDALQTEVQRLEELKLKNLQTFTEAIRRNIASLWEKCFYSAEQCQAFLPYYEDDFTEGLLSLHEEESARLSRHYENHRELYEGVQKWDENWRLYLELEGKAKDPSRFANRGGNLLKEEKQRADLVKGLPKLEKKLKAEIEQWELEQNREFLVNGQKFMQFVADQWDSFRAEREREKQERQLKKIKETEEDMVYGTVVRSPSKKRFPGSATPCKVRKLNATSSTGTSISTLRSVCQSPIPRHPSSASKGNAVKTHGKPPHPAVFERNKENLCHRIEGLGVKNKMPASPQRNFSINSVASTYSEFQRDLSKPSKSNYVPDILNSTIIHR